jgi:hypothetical protein
MAVLVGGLLGLLLLLEETVDLEPVGATTVARSALRHANQQTLSKTTSFARCSILLVDDALSIIFALGNRR